MRTRLWATRLLTFVFPVLLVSRVADLQCRALIGGLLLGALGCVIRAWAILHRHTSATPLLTRGPYRFVRHPRYAGTILSYVGLSLATGFNPLAVMATMVLAGLHHAASVQEEAELAAKFGRVYQTYKRDVPRYLPRLSWVPADTRDAFRIAGERRLMIRHLMPALLLPLVFTTGSVVALSLRPCCERRLDTGALGRIVSLQITGEVVLEALPAIEKRLLAAR